MDAVEDSVPDHLKCPICYHLPRGKVFQCKDGHIICEHCYKSVRICPQCRVAYTADGIRNRLLEEMLDDLKLDCPFKDSGCNNKFTRNTLDNHAQTCSYDQSRPSINLCKLIGYSNCSFLVKVGNAFAAIQHFQQVHQLCVENASLAVKLEYCNFADTVTKKGLDATSDSQMLLWKPVVITTAEQSSAVVLLTIQNKADTTIFWLPVGIDCESAAQANFYIIDEVGSPNEGEFSLKWGIRLIDVMKIRDVLSRMHSIRTSTSLLVEKCTAEGSLLVHCKMKLGKKKIELQDTPTMFVMPELTKLNLNNGERPKGAAAEPKALIEPPAIRNKTIARPLIAISKDVSFIGRYKLVSFDNFESYLKATKIRVPPLTSFNDQKDKQIIDIVDGKDGYLIDSPFIFNPWERTKINFTLGEPFIERTEFGFWSKTIVIKTENRLIQDQSINVHGVHIKNQLIREFLSDEMKVTCAAKGVTATRVYKRV